MKKLTSKEICYGVIAAVACACLLVYMFVVKNYNEKTDVLKASNAELRQKVEDMKQYYDNMEFYKSEKTRMTGEVNTLTADYPGNAREEDTIMMAVDLNNTAIVNFDDITIGKNDAIHTIPQETVAAAGIDGLDSAIVFRQRQATYGNTTDYLNLKTMINRIYESPYRIGVNSIAYAKASDSNNLIEGTIDITYYNLEGMNKEYKKPDMSEYLSGSEELFGLNRIDENIRAAVTEE